MTDIIYTKAEVDALIAAIPAGPAGPQGIPGAGGLPYVADLKAFMDSHYGVGNWTPRTGVGIGTDIGPALVDACTFLRSTYGRGVIEVPPQTFLMNTSPTAAQLSGIKIKGQGSMATGIVWNSNSGAAFYWSGAGGYTGGGMEGVSLFLESGYPTSTAIAILLQGDATYQPDQTMWSDLYITALGTSYWYNGFFAYGVARTAPQGIRVGDITNLQIFRCSNTGFYGANLVQWSGRNIGVYVGTGTGQDFYLTGGGTSSTNTIHTDFRLVNATLNIGNLSDSYVNGTYYT